MSSPSPVWTLRHLYDFAASDFTTFVQVISPLLTPGGLEWNWHLEANIYVLQEVQRGARRRQIINMPPRTLKSQLNSVLWPAFLLGQNPETRILVVSYSDQLADALSTETRRVMQADLYKAIFPGTQLQTERAGLLVTTVGGARRALTTGGSITGFGADYIILDDPQNATDIYSDPYRERAKEFVQRGLMSRVNDPRTARMVMIAQRLHEDDLSGFLLESGDWELLKLQALATEAASIPLGLRRMHQVNVGDYLMPSRFTPEFLAGQQRMMNSMNFEAQYQQEPAPATGNIIRREWLAYDKLPPRDQGRVTLSLDTASKTNPANDYSVVTAWLECGGTFHLLHVWRDKVDYPTLEKTLYTLIAQFQPQDVLIEDAGNGTALIQAMRSRRHLVTPIKPTGTKESRLSSVSSYFESSLVWLPPSAPWLDGYVNELLAFPNGKHDDQVDSTTQYLSWEHQRPGSVFKWEFM